MFGERLENISHVERPRLAQQYRCLEVLLVLSR